MVKIQHLCLFLVLFGISFSLERKSYLKCGQQLYVNEHFESTNGYYAVLQGDCNFVIYRSKHFVVRNALWSSGSVNTECNNPILINQGDGNIVIYNNGVASLQNAIWSSRTNTGNCYSLLMQDDGNLVLYTPDLKVPVWASRTNA